MSHSATMNPIPAKAKIHYVIILSVILALAIAYIVVRGIAGSIDNTSIPVQQNTNTTSQGTTQDTGAPTQDSGTAADRTTPSSSGGEGNSILNQ